MDGAQYVIGVDQGTSASKAIVLGPDGDVVGRSRGFEVPHQFPRPGFVEFQPKDMLRSVELCIEDALRDARLSPRQVRAIGLANQGETVIAFDRLTGQPIAPAVSWQDRRAEPLAQRWSLFGEEITRVTGLRASAYFSAPKMSYILSELPEAGQLARQGRLALGTSDAWLLWHLTDEHSFVTDVATASRTMLFALARADWDEGLLTRFEIPRASLPAVVPNDETVGHLVLDGVRVPICGLCVDQHAALFGHGCLRSGQTKITYGTGCFVLTNVGDRSALRVPGLLTALGWSLRGHGTDYVVEGSVFSAASAINWLEEVGILRDLSEIDAVAALPSSDGVYFVPAFVGMAAPHWNERVRASFHGITLGTTRAHLIRSAVEAIAFQVKDIVSALEDNGLPPSEILADGGLTRSAFLVRFQAGLLHRPILSADDHDVTAFGVGCMAGLGSGLWKGVDALPWRKDAYRRVEPDESLGGNAAYHDWRRICLRELEAALP